MKKKEKVRTAMLVVDGDELRRIVEEGLGGITFTDGTVLVVKERSQSGEIQVSLNDNVMKSDQHQ